ncbi:MAG TPA: tetratricopeptide repeat protein, partial [Polyangiales bacterium]|nr:tetratricopeptide repeat protein [Polyangiales bacterium]
MSRPLTPVLLVALMCAAVTVVYAGRLSGPPVFDDHESILGNASIQALRLPDVLRPPRETPVAGRPLPNLTFALNHALTGNEPGPLHATNLLFHLLAVALAFGLVRATLAHGRVPERLRAGAGPLAFATALLFAVHPVAVEIVLYATQRTEGLVAIFYLAALLVLARAAARGHTHPSHVAAMLACALCGALSKEVFVTAPLLALFYDRAFFAGSFVQALRARAKLYAALVVSWPALFALQRTAPRPVSVRAFELEYLLAQGEIVLGYLRLAFVPLHPVFDYGPLLPQKLGVIWPYLAITGGLLAVGTWLALARPRLGFVAACFFGVLAPSSGLLSIFPEVGAERRVYLPLVALLAYAVVAIASALRSQTLQRVLLVVVTCGFALCARVQAGNYASELQVWRSSVSARPGNPRAHFHLGDELHEQGSLSNAERELRTAIALKPNYRDAYVSLAEVLGEQGRGDEAVRALRTALSFDPDYTRPGARLPPKRTHVEARAALVLQLVELGRLDEARAALAWLTRVVPNDSHTRTLRERLRQAEQARLPQLAARAWNAAPPFGPAGQWLGADSAYSVELDARHVLWLFGDTFLDPRADGHRTDGPAFFIRNS